jgi:CRP-like cAMP-binding protein
MLRARTRREEKRREEKRREEKRREEKLAVLKQGNYFGEQALLREDVRQASCFAESKVTCLTLGTGHWALGREDLMEST